MQRCQTLHKAVAGYVNQSGLAPYERKDAQDMFINSATIVAHVKNAEGDRKTLLDIEHDRLRPLGLSTRQYGARKHLAALRPFWSTTKCLRDPNGIAVFGRSDLSQTVNEILDDHRLTRIDHGGTGPIDLVNWLNLRSCALAVFDFRSQCKPKAIRSAAHALGVSLALGTHSLIVADDDAEMPFNVNNDPLRIDDVTDLKSQLGETLVNRLTAPFPNVSAGTNPHVQTAKYVLAQMAGSNDTVIAMTPKITEECRRETPDAVVLAHYLQQTLDMHQPPEFLLARPFEPISYPDPGSRHCFHLLAFSHPYASEAVSQACTSAKYSRGDTTGELDVISGIWTALCTATDVIVDITPRTNDTSGLPTENVAVELGIAQALGCRILIVRDVNAGHLELFPEISRLQVHQYSSEAELRQMTINFLAG